MANYTNLKNIIDQYITTNGQGDITGAILNDVLKSIVNSIGAGFLFAGVAEPTTNPGSPDQNIFYIAIKGGTYTNFGNVVIPNGISIFKWDGNWSNQILFADDGGVFDITAFHNNTKYADLTAALGTNGANVPQSLQKGGMSVKFVQSSDNKYVQYRYMADDTTTSTTFTNTDNWSFCGDDVEVKSSRYVRVLIDSEKRILEVINADGTKETFIPAVFDKDATFKGSVSVSGDISTEGDVNIGSGSIKSIDSNRYLSVMTDNDNRIIQAIEKDGTLYVPKNIRIVGSIENGTIRDYALRISSTESSIDNIDNYINNPNNVVPHGYLSKSDSSKWLQITLDNDGRILGGRKYDGTLVENMPIENPTINEIKEDVSSLREDIEPLLENTQTIFSLEEYNQVREDKCTNGMRYLLYSDGSAPFMRVIKNGKISQDRSGRNNLAKVAIFGDVHFGYTNTGDWVIDPTSEDRCGMAFTASNSKNADFSIILGDVMQGGTVAQIAEAYELYYQKLALLKTPCFPIDGNHDDLTNVKIVTGDNVFTKTGIIEFGNVRIICFNAEYVGATTDIGRHNGDVTDEVYAWLVNAVKDSYEKGFVTILANHYSLYYNSENRSWDQSLRNHRDDIIELCHDYNVKLYLHGHVHTAGLIHEIVRNDTITCDMTDVLFGWGFMTYSILEVTENAFDITEYDAMTDEVLHTLHIPMTNQASGTIYT